MAKCSRCGKETSDPGYMCWLGIGGQYLCRPCARDELLQLRAIVEQLPKCWRLNEDRKLSQDKPVVIGMQLFLPDEDGGISSWEHGCGYIADCCDSRETAEKMHETRKTPDTNPTQQLLNESVRRHG